MSDEKDDKWEMPNPVFRSSTGELPKSLQKTISGYNMPKARITGHDDDDAEDDILSVLDHPVDPKVKPAVEEDMLETETKSGAEVPADAATASTAESETEAADEAKTEPIKVAAAKPKPKKRSGVGSFILILLLIAALAAGLFWAVMYYLSHRAGNGTF